MIDKQLKRPLTVVKENLFKIVTFDLSKKTCIIRKQIPDFDELWGIINLSLIYLLKVIGNIHNFLATCLIQDLCWTMHRHWTTNNLINSEYHFFNIYIYFFEYLYDKKCNIYLIHHYFSLKYRFTKTSLIDTTVGIRQLNYIDTSTVTLIPEVQSPEFVQSQIGKYSRVYIFFDRWLPLPGHSLTFEM